MTPQQASWLTVPSGRHPSVLPTYVAMSAAGGGEKSQGSLVTRALCHLLTMLNPKYAALSSPNPACAFKAQLLSRYLGPRSRLPHPPSSPFP